MSHLVVNLALVTACELSAFILISACSFRRFNLHLHNLSDSCSRLKVLINLAPPFCELNVIQLAYETMR